MLKRIPTKAINQTLGLILVLIYLSGCTQFAGVASSPSVTSLATSSTASVTVIPFTSSVQSSTETFAITPLAEPGTNSPSLELSKSSTSQKPEITPTACQLSAITLPPRPEKTFSPNELDTENNLHVTGLMQWIDLSTYRLKVSGLVDHSLSLTYDEIRCMPAVTDNPELVCAGVFTDYASWTGVPLEYILDLAGVQQGATELTLVSADGYQVRVPLETTKMENIFLAYEVNGKTLPVQHGFPLRAVFPGMVGSYWLKWLVEIRVS